MNRVQLRRQARSMALQVLYELDCTTHDVSTVVYYRLSETPLDEETELFVRETVHGVLDTQAELDVLIHEHAPDWPVDQMAIIDRNILRIAIFELTVSQKTPLKVVINEAVELAKSFGSDSAPRFINGVLGTLVS